MLDIKAIRSNPAEIEKKLKTKDPSADIQTLLLLDEKSRKLKTETESIKARQNQASKEIGQKKGDQAALEPVLKQMQQLKQKASGLEEELKAVEEEKNTALLNLPNLPFDDIDISSDPKDNREIKRFREKRQFDFPFKNHLELNQKLKLFDFDRAAKISGAGWPLYSNLGFKLEWALINYMLDTHIKNGFIPVMPPLLCRPQAMRGSGQLPKFAHQLFKVQDEDYQLYLIPTAEVILNSLQAGEILPEDSLPLFYVSYTPCFRREAGAAGKQERGLIRTHQFNKVEMFAFTTPEQSEKAFDRLLLSANEVLQGLDLHYRNMQLVTGDMSFAAAKTVDVEVFLPGQDRYYEVSSVSNCTDFQARRSQIRCKPKNGKPFFVHTLNGSGVATSRLMVALLENNQQKDGSVVIPKVLHKYLEEEITVLKPV